MARLAVARLWFCANSFNPRRTRLADLQRHEWTDGPAALAHRRAAGSEIDGLAAFLSARPGWDAAMLRCAAAPPGGPLAAEVLGGWLAEVEAALRPGGFDGLYLSLHGACQAEGDPAADVTVLRRLRLIARRMPVVATFDSRANIADETTLLLDGASAVREPADAAAAAVRALTMLEGILAGRIRPVGSVARVAAVIPPSQLRRVMAQLHADEAAHGWPGLLDASLFSGFAWSDTPCAGPAAMAWADRDAGTAREAASHLALLLARGRERDAAQTLSPAAGTIANAAARSRTLLLDQADDPESGGLGDTTGLLRAVLAWAEAAPAAGLSAVGVLADQCAVAAAHAVGVGGEFDPALGACYTPVYGLPVTVRVRVVRLLQEMVLLQAGPVAILVADRPVPAGPGLFAGAGIDLPGLHLLAVKGGEAARDAFAADFPVAISVNCPGPSSHDLSGLPFNYVPEARRAPDAAERFAAEQQRPRENERREQHARLNPRQPQSCPQGIGPQVKPGFVPA